ncbi:MAG: DeoR/GlpR transcriptional regulator [Anaerolineales bacterium]|nr:DeoR/GlpR transcriptional regulator [Anaerolineales bacterium]
MLKIERHRQIKQVIEEKGTATVNELSELFNVSEMTIRRDLQALFDRGLVQRVHGGALSLNHSVELNWLPVMERISECKEEKQRIGQAVADMIDDGETLFICSGTTTLAVAEALYFRSNLTVVTNSLPVANTLASAPGVELIVIGGFLRESELALEGHMVEDAVQDLRVDKVIMGMRGIDPTHGLTSIHHQELKINRTIQTISNTLIIVADHTKFGQVAASRTGPVTEASLIVSDNQAPAEIVQAIRDLGVEVMLV